VLVAYTVNNLKKGEASDGFEKDFLAKRICETKNLVFGETGKAESFTAPGT